MLFPVFKGNNFDKIADALKKNTALLRQMFGSRFYIKLAMLVCIPIIAVVAFFSQAGCAIVLENEVIAVASSQEKAKQAVDDYFTRLEKTIGKTLEIEEKIEYRPTWKFAGSSDTETIVHQLTSKLDKQFGATGIFVDDKLVAVVKDVETGNQVMDTLSHTYNNKNAEQQVSFKQKVELKPASVNVSELMDVEETLEYIRFGGTKARTYNLEEGDNLWDIAAAVHLSVEELTKANPDLNPDKLQIGQQIIISQTSPLIDVITECEQTCREEILYRVQEKVAQDLYLGERKVIQPGQSGEREASYQITMENGVETGKKLLKEKIIKEPVPKIIAKGTRKLLAFRGGSGRLAYPTVGSIDSPFGSRWGRTHSGVDIGANYGSPVVSAEVGTVQRAGSKGGYGLSIDITHGGGVVTRYAHLSSVAVKAGQRVERGQFIGRAGSSGNSTGPHLHFEVLVNGVHKNPSLFI